MCVLPTDGQGRLLAWPGIICVFGERVTQGKRRRFSVAMASSRIYPAENFYCYLEKEVSVSGPAASLPESGEMSRYTFSTRLSALIFARYAFTLSLGVLGEKVSAIASWPLAWIGSKR